MASQHTGSFWLCPSCSKHVPTRQPSCKCGFDRVVEKAAVPVITARPSSNVRAPGPAERDRVGKPWKTIATIGVTAVVVAGALMVIQNRRPQVAPTFGPPPAGVADLAVTRGADPDVVLLPSQQPSPASDPRPLSAAEQVELAARLAREERGLGEERKEAPAADPAGDAAARETIQRQEAMQRQQEILDQQLQHQRELEERATQRQWQLDHAQVMKDLRTTIEGYRSQVCGEARGAISLSMAGADPRNQYVVARELAKDLESRADRAGVSRSKDWQAIPWGDFPEPEPLRGDPQRVSMILFKWKCPNR